MPLYTAFTIDELALLLQKENALGVPGAQEWVNDLPSEQNRKFVADYRKKYPNLRPTYYGAQPYDAAQLINSAVVAVGGDTSKKDAQQAPMEKAQFPSPPGRGELNPWTGRFNRSQHAPANFQDSCCSSSNNF